MTRRLPLLPLLTSIAAIAAGATLAEEPAAWSIDRGGAAVPLDPAFVRQQPRPAEAAEAWSPSGLGEGGAARLLLFPALPGGGWYGSGWRSGGWPYLTPYATSPYTTSPYSMSPYSMSPYSISPYATSPYGGYAGSPYAATGWWFGGWPGAAAIRIEGR
jgi:hypothetical protein